MTNTLEIFQQLTELGLTDSYTVGDLEEYMDSIAEESKAVADMLSMSGNPEFIKNLTLEELTKFPFDKAHKIINSLPMAKRISILDSLDVHRVFLYEQSNRYMGVSREETITPKEFQMLIGKIKHLEILQAWLYGIQ